MSVVWDVDAIRTLSNVLDNLSRGVLWLKFSIILIVIWLSCLTHKIRKSEISKIYDLKDGPTPPLKNGETVNLIGEVKFPKDPDCPQSLEDSK